MTKPFLNRDRWIALTLLILAALSAAVLYNLNFWGTQIDCTSELASFFYPEECG